MSVPPSAIVAATSAICSGVTAVVPWPYAALASSTSSTNPSSGPPPEVTWLTAVGRSNGMGASKPMRRAQSRRAAAPVARPTWAK